jgi:hypothetical protein
VVVLAVFLPSTAWCIPYLGLSCIDHNSSRIGAITNNSNRSNFNRNSHNSSSSSNNSTMLLPHRHSRLPPGLDSIFPPVTFYASTIERWATLLENATSPSKATHHELRHLCSTSREAIRRVLHHILAAPTTPPWRRFRRGKKC